MFLVIGVVSSCWDNGGGVGVKKVSKRGLWQMFGCSAGWRTLNFLSILFSGQWGKFKLLSPFAHCLVPCALRPVCVEHCSRVNLWRTHPNERTDEHYAKSASHGCSRVLLGYSVNSTMHWIGRQNLIASFSATVETEFASEFCQREYFDLCVDFICFKRCLILVRVRAFQLTVRQGRFKLKIITKN
jgi:hypothetical protein